jgi:hypothetical protein
MTSQRNLQPWKPAELENLITWMEEVLRGRPSDWVNEVEESIFPDDAGFAHITVKKVKDKYNNMKKAWKDIQGRQCPHQLVAGLQSLMDLAHPGIVNWISYYV